MYVDRSKLLIHCKTSLGKYLVAFPGEDLKQAHPSLELALDWARSLVDRETPVTVLDEKGQTLMKTTVKPHPTEEDWS